MYGSRIVEKTYGCMRQHRASQRSVSASTTTSRPELQTRLRTLHASANCRPSSGFHAAERMACTFVSSVTAVWSPLRTVATTCGSMLSAATCLRGGDSRT